MILINFFKNMEEIFKKITLEKKNILKLNQQAKQKLQNIVNTILNGNKINLSTIQEIAIKENKTYQVSEEDTRYVKKSVLYSEGKFNCQTDKKNNVFRDIQRQQIENLNQEERDALILYKSSLFRPINKIMSLIRKNNIDLETALATPEFFKEINNIIATYHKKFVTEANYIQTKEESQINRTSKAENPKSITRIMNKYHNQIPNKEEYSDLVLKSIPLIKSALSKVRTTEDIIVYRGTNGLKTNITDYQRFLSTSISFNQAMLFAYNEERKKASENTRAKITQIIIPKGSPLIVFTNDLFEDKYIEGKVFDEPQQEILIDPDNFDFEFAFHHQAIDKREFDGYIAIPKKQQIQERKH